MKKFLWLPLLLIVLAACSSKVPHEKTAAEYFQEGEQYFDDGQYNDAIKSWEKVREIFYSPELNMLAELKIAEAHFLNKDYVEAAVSYEDFLKQHPTYPQTDTVLFQLGKSYFQQILSLDRDQTATRNALATFNTLLKSYPDFPQKAKVEQYRQSCLDELVAHEIYVGNFYMRTEHYEAAIKRLEGVYVLYPGHYYEKDRDLYLLGQAYKEAGQREKAVDSLNALLTQFPTSEYAPKAQKLLKKLGQ